ncbi:MAG: ribosome biogenesis GTPase Der [Deltaproteobacteria bacterium]|nr:ribosome biogenesis GTPase Der [Deltaproteobacteria bacterium]
MARRNKIEERAEASRISTAAKGLPVVVLVGRANVGKSTLFNRIVRRGRAIVSPIAGTTRDLNMSRATHEGREFVVIDSGGLELYAQEHTTERAVEEALRAVAEADVVVFVMDGRAGLSSGDNEALTLIRETGRPTIVAVNKIDRPNIEAEAADAYSLGVPSVTFVSAAHGLGVGELLDAIVEQLPPHEATPDTLPDLRLALIGRPNVGKSSLLNRLAGFDRAIVDDRPGTTRDPVDVRLSVAGRDVLLIDTAGIRRPTKVDGDLEHHSVGRAIEVIRRAEVLVLVIDSTEGITDQDVRLARLVESNDRAMVSWRSLRISSTTYRPITFAFSKTAFARRWDWRASGHRCDWSLGALADRGWSRGKSRRLTDDQRVRATRQNLGAGARNPIRNLTKRRWFRLRALRRASAVAIVRSLHAADFTRRSVVTRATYRSIGSARCSVVARIRKIERSGASTSG